MKQRVWKVIEKLLAFVLAVGVAFEAVWTLLDVSRAESTLDIFWIVALAVLFLIALFMAAVIVVEWIKHRDE